jgi:CelD/BcsL family acetyltransferase involved in cellulose biosynthesis
MLPWPATVTVARLVSTDHAPVTASVPIRPERLAAVLGALGDRLSGWGVGLLHLGEIAGRYAHVDALAAACREALAPGYGTEVAETDVQTYFPVAESWEAQLAGLSKQERKRLRQVYREVEAQGAELRSDLATRETLAADFDGFVAMHQARWAGAGRAGHFVAWPDALAFHRRVAERQLERGRLRLLKVSLGGEPVGYKYSFRFGSTYCAYLDARARDAEDGRIVFARLTFGEQVRKAMSEGVRLIDSMRGRYEHKLHLGGVLKPVRAVNLVSTAPGAAARAAALRASAWALDAVYNRIWRRRLAARAGFRQGPFRRSWVRSHPLAFAGRGSKASGEAGQKG